MSEHGLWSRLEGQLGLVSLRPRLSQDVRVRHIGEEHELVQQGTRRVLPLSDDEARAVTLFDGSRTVAEIIVGGMEEGSLEVEPVLTLVDRLVRAEMLDQYPPDLYRQLENHLSLEHGAPRDRARDTPAEPDPPVPDQDPDPAGVDPRRDAEGPWRPRSAAVAERARFLRDVPLFASVDLRTIGALADAAHEETWPAKSFIVSEGARADRFFLVRNGDVCVERRDEHGDFHGVAELGSGDWFGEAALLEDAPRNATVRAGERSVQVLSFDTEVFERYIAPHVAEMGSELVSQRRAQLQQVPVFQALAGHDLDRLGKVLREKTFPRGSVLFRQGDQADAFYVIVEGSVGVVKDGRPIAKLVAGEFFGETALLFTEERTATIAATEDSRFWVLDRESFQTFLRDALLHRRDLMPTVLNRIASTDPV